MSFELELKLFTNEPVTSASSIRKGRVHKPSPNQYSSSVIVGHN